MGGAPGSQVGGRAKVMPPHSNQSTRAQALRWHSTMSRRSYTRDGPPSILSFSPDLGLGMNLNEGIEFPDELASPTEETRGFVQDPRSPISLLPPKVEVFQDPVEGGEAVGSPVVREIDGVILPYRLQQLQSLLRLGIYDWIEAMPLEG